MLTFLSGRVQRLAYLGLALLLLTTTSARAAFLENQCAYTFDGITYEWMQTDFPTDTFRFLNEQGQAVIFLPGTFPRWEFFDNNATRSREIVTASAFATGAATVDVSVQIFNDQSEAFGTVVMLRNPADPQAFRATERASTTFAFRWTPDGGFQDLAEVVPDIFTRNDVGTETRILIDDQGNPKIQTIDWRTTPETVSEKAFVFDVDTQEQRDAISDAVLDAVMEACTTVPADSSATTLTNTSNEFAVANTLLRIAKPRVNVDLSYDWLVTDNDNVVQFERGDTGTISDQISFEIPIFNAGFVDVENLETRMEFTGDQVFDYCCGDEFPTALASGQGVDRLFMFYDAIAEGSVTATAVVTGTDNIGNPFESRSRSRQLTVRPELTIRIILPDRPLRVDEDVQPKVSVTSNLGQSATVMFTGPILSSNDTTIVSFGNTDNPGEFELDPGETRTFELTSDIQLVGRIEATTEVTATTRNGRTFNQPARRVVDVTDSAIGVVLEVTPQPFVINMNETENILTITATLTNNSDERQTNVHIDGEEEGLNLTSADPDDESVPLEPVGFITPENYPFDFEPGDTGVVSWEYKAVDAPAKVNASVAALAEQDGQTVNGLGKEEFEVVSDIVAKWGVRRTGFGTRMSGFPIRVEGYIENVTEDVAIGIVLYPLPKDNAARGILYNASLGVPSNANLSSCDPALRRVDLEFLFDPQGDGSTDISQAFVLKPGESIDLTAILATICWDMPSQASVSYFPVAKSLEMDEDGEIVRNLDGEPVVLADVTAQLEVGESRTVDEMEITGFGDGFTVPLSPNTPPEDNFGLDCGSNLLNLACDGYDTVALWFEMLGDLGPFLLDVASADVSYGKRFASYVLQTIGLWGGFLFEGEVVTLLDSIKNESLLHMRTLVNAGIITKDQAAEAVNKGVEEYAAFARDVDNQDFNAVRKFFVFTLNAAPEIMLETGALKMAMTKAKRGMAARGAAQDADNLLKREAQRFAEESTEAAVDAKYTRADNNPAVESIPKQVAEVGDNLSYRAITRYWGGGTAEIIKEMEKLAVAFNVRLGFRSRAFDSIELLRSRLAYNKVELMKIKTGNRIDVDYLGVPATRVHPESGTLDSKLIVRVVEPPVLRGNLSDNALDQRIITWMRQNHPDVPPNSELGHRIRQRAKLRADEWKDYQQSGLLDTWAKDGIPVAFNYVAQGIPKFVESILNFGRAPSRKLKLTPSTYVDEFGNTRQIIDVDMDGVDGFRPFTGDVDFVHILNMDGTFITDLSKRIRIYKALQDLIGMQHGESFAFIVDLYRRAKYLDAHNIDIPFSEGIVDISPEGRKVAKYVRNRAVIDGLTNGTILPNPTGSFLVVTGPRQALKSANAVSRTLNTFSWSQNFQATLITLAVVVHQTVEWPELLDDLDQGDIAPDSSRSLNAPVLRPTDDGELQQWTSDAGWRTVSVDNVRDEDGLLRPALFSTLTVAAGAGSRTLEIASPADLGQGTTAFAAGDVVTINPGEANEETITVQALGSLISTDPLQFDHKVGEMVVLVRAVETTTDTDGDGVLDFEDAFPDDDRESRDTDADGIGNNTDTDDDGDGISDDDESRYNSDPLDPNDRPIDHRPEQPVVMGLSRDSQNQGMLVSTDSTPFVDPDETGSASSAEIQVIGPIGDGSDGVVYQSVVDRVEEFVIPHAALDTDVTYELSIRYQDATGQYSVFSEPVDIVGMPVPDDMNTDGISDRAEVLDATDLNNNGTSDTDEGITPLRTATTGEIVGLQVSEGMVRRITTHTTAELPDQPSDDLAMGLFGFRIDNVPPGESVELTFHSSTDLGTGAKWLQYDPLQALYLDLTDQAVVTTNTITVRYTDGGTGDLDGVVNGRIVDPSGPVLGTVQTSPPPTAPSAGSSSGGDSRCFVASAVFGEHAVLTNQLRAFRDVYLMNHATGRSFVRWYYQHSPTWVSWLEGKPFTTAAIQIGLTPVAVLAGAAVGENGLLLLLLWSLVLMLYARRQLRSQPRLTV